MAGSPVAIADQYDTIGDNLRFLTNHRLLSLVKEGFHAKPLSRDINNVNSSHWVGSCPDGDIVISFFNREEYATVRNFRLSDAGITSLPYYTDLWTGEEALMEGEEFKVRLAAHSCKVYRFSARKGFSAVEDMSVHDDERKEIYTIGGHKVKADGFEGLPSGIYIVRENGKCRKVSIK